MIKLQPMDIVVFAAQDKLLHKVIEWRSLDNSVHCTTIRDPDGWQYDPDFGGLKLTNLEEYRGRALSVHRYKYDFDEQKLIAYCDNVMKTNTGYDNSQWLFGFVLGITAKKLADDENAWTCAELPYWAFTESGYALTQREEVLPMPRLFKYNPHFDCIFEGTL